MSPQYEVRYFEGELMFLVGPLDGSAGDPVPLLAAGEAEGRLVLRETEHYRRMAERCAEAQLYARSTLAPHLAVRGRPLARGEEEWERAHMSCDIGEAEIRMRAAACTWSADARTAPTSYLLPPTVDCRLPNR